MKRAVSAAFKKGKTCPAPRKTSKRSYHEKYHDQSKKYQSNLANTFGPDFLWPEVSGSLGLEVPISTNQEICFQTILQTREALAKGRVPGTGASISLSSLAHHHLYRLNKLQDHYRLLKSIATKQYVDEQVEKINRQEDQQGVGIIYHNTKHYTCGFPLTLGFKELVFSIKHNSSYFSDIFKQNGGIHIGQSSILPIGYRAETKNSIIGLTRNPYNPERTVGGSSGGAAACIAAGIGNVALADDGAGSISIPAGFTGTIGVKPSTKSEIFGKQRCGVDGTATGTITRSISDAAFAWDVLTNSTDFSKMVQMCSSDYGVSLKYEKAKIGFICAFPWTEFMDPTVRTAFLELFSNMQKDFKVSSVQDYEFHFKNPDHAAGVLWMSKLPGLIRHFISEEDELLGRMIEASKKIKQDELLDAVAVKQQVENGIKKLFHNYSYLVVPVTSHTAWPAGQGKPIPSPHKLTDFSFNFAYYFNIADCPVITIPLGVSKELVPFGVQIVGPPHSSMDALVELLGLVAIMTKYTNYQPHTPDFAELKYCFSEDEYGWS